jgi:hypothetical protein
MSAPLLAELLTTETAEEGFEASGRVRLTNWEEPKFSGAFRLSADMVHR